MKLFKLITLILTFAILITACKKSDVVPSIFGTWNYDYRDGTYIMRMSYKFASDSTVLYTTTVLDSTKKQLGYRYKMTGRFRLNGNTLGIFQSSVSSFQNAPPNVLYTTEQNLTPLVFVAAEQKVTLDFNADKTSFGIVPPPCPFNANCVAYMGPFIKQ